MMDTGLTLLHRIKCTQPVEEQEDTNAQEEANRYSTGI